LEHVLRVNKPVILAFLSDSSFIFGLGVLLSLSLALASKPTYITPSRPNPWGFKADTPKHFLQFAMFSKSPSWFPGFPYSNIHIDERRENKS
jgi:hypothetical protein